jgi:hypothetical protein
MTRLGQLVAACLLVLCMEPAEAGPDYQAIRFDQLLGWQYDNHDEALEAFRKSCMDIRAGEWAPLCALAETHPRPEPF